MSVTENIELEDSAENLIRWVKKDCVFYTQSLLCYIFLLIVITLISG